MTLPPQTERPQADSACADAKAGPVEEAAHWHTLMHADDVTDEQRAAFRAWYANPQHADAYQRMDTLWAQLDSVDGNTAQHTVTAVLARQAEEAQKRKRRAKLSTTITGLLVIVGLSAAQFSAGNHSLADVLLSGRLFADYRTAVGEDQVITLSDQTRLHLNTFSSVNIEYSDTERTIHLLQGDIHLDVATDAARPLVVRSGQASARALGTVFSVRDRGEQTEVRVTESEVEVCAADTARPCQRLQAGELTRVRDGDVQLPELIDPGFVHDWSQQLLIVDDQPVLDVVDELSRYHTGIVRIDRKALAGDTVSGVFALNDFAKSLQALEGSVPLSVSRYTPMLTLIGKK